MSPPFLSIALFTLYLPHLIAASQCQTCDSFNAALKSCQTTGTNSTAVGSKTDTETVHCMCVSSSSSTEMADCAYCNEEVSTDGVVVDGNVLAAWIDTCAADKTWGDQQAVACWEGQPGDSFSCTDAAGPGPDQVVGSASTPTRPATKAPSTTTTLSPEITQSTKASSEATISSRAFGILSTIFIGLSVLLATQ
ncbi:hypothetical protein JMJ35_004966 [Cladonia borealis]|uniref:Uncharacterized protein n=1 Tax=Cladonia borealis TaxID=184061 RepID=A0AA39R367_9LECA|nr:hypothetical protein JMJ35_004966 [Cladonia borealis]